MADIRIRKLNEVYLHIVAEKAVLTEMSAYFTFEVPGAKFTPAFKNRLWDGRIRMLNIGTRNIYAGLYYHILEFAEKSGYTIEKDEDVNPTSDISRDIIARYINTVVNPHSNGKKLDIREYQLDAIHHCIKNKRAIIVSPTSSGKSLILFSVTRYLLGAKEAKRVLFIFPTTALVSQMASDFSDYSSESGWDVSARSHLIYAGQEKYSNKALTFSTYQSLANQPISFFDQFDAVVVDEVHTAKSKSITTILERCHNIIYRIGVTGTLTDGKAHKLVIEGLFGRAYTTTTTSELIKKNEVSELSIKCVLLKYPESSCKIMKDATYAEELKYICLNEHRNRFIANLTKSLTGNTLVLFNYIEHGKILYELLKHKGNVHFVHGKIPVDKREEVRKIAESTSDCIIIASVGVFSTGINIRNLQHGIFATPSKSQIRVLQSLGRIIRLNGKNSKATLFDIADDLSWKSHKNYTLGHFEDRVSIYATNKLNYKIVECGIHK
jgi:superfamily II DNA or RNA helicase